MDEEKIKLTGKELEEFYAKTGSQHFKLQSTVFEKYGGQTIGIYFKLVEFTNQIVTVMGVIAGLGFTALASIKSRPPFVVGQALLFTGILIGIYLVHRIYYGELLNLQNSQRLHSEHFGKRNKIFKKIWEDLNSDGANQEDLKKLLEIDQQTIANFDSKDKNGNYLEKLGSYQRILLYFLAGGCIMVLFSILY